LLIILIATEGVDGTSNIPIWILVVWANGAVFDETLVNEHLQKAHPVLHLDDLKLLLIIHPFEKFGLVPLPLHLLLHRLQFPLAPSITALVWSLISFIF